MGSWCPLTPAHQGHRKDEHSLRKLRTSPRDMLQEVTGRVTAALHGQSPRACHPGPQEVGASLQIWGLDQGSEHHVSLAHLSKNQWARKEPGATGGSRGTHQIMRNGLYQVALCHCPS